MTRATSRSGTPASNIRSAQLRLKSWCRCVLHLPGISRRLDNNAGLLANPRNDPAGPFFCRPIIRVRVAIAAVPACGQRIEFPRGCRSLDVGANAECKTAPGERKLFVFVEDNVGAGNIDGLSCVQEIIGKINRLDRIPVLTASFVVPVPRSLQGYRNGGEIGRRTCRSGIEYSTPTDRPATPAITSCCQIVVPEKTENAELVGRFS